MAKSSMERKMEECMQPHALLHTATGLGLGFLVVALVPALVSSALLIGVVLLVVGVGGELLRK